MRWVPARSYQKSHILANAQYPNSNCEFPITYLENHAGGDDGGDTQFHQGTPVTGQHHTEPVQRVGGVRGDNSVQGHLTHDQEDQESQLQKQSISLEALVELDKYHVPPSTSTSG